MIVSIENVVYELKVRIIPYSVVMLDKVLETRGARSNVR